jgi:GNAT superfamily N-acetyltransferase
MSKPITIYPATAERWIDLEALFGQHGAYADCWCMFWRLSRSDFKRMKGAGTQAALREMTLKNEVPGLLAYDHDQPVGWCSVGPRQHFLALENSRILKRLDDLPVWSIVCFFVAKNHRRHGLTGELIKAAVDYARKRGATIVESYPIEVASGSYPDAFAYTGFSSTFISTGFKAVARRSERRAIYRLYL